MLTNSAKRAASPTNMTTPSDNIDRRTWLKTSSCGFGMLALNAMVNSARAANPLVGKAPHHRPRAKRIIFLFMQGGPSQVDTFDYKKRLAKSDGSQLRFHNARKRKETQERVFRSPWKFDRYGERGQWVSELFPEITRHVDDLCVINSMHTEGVAHGPATLFLHTGATNLIRPSFGSWLTYGLGTENQSLPGFVTISPPPTKGGPRNYSNGFLPAAYQGTAIGRAGIPIAKAGIRHVRNRYLGKREQKRQVDLLQQLNRVQIQLRADDELEAAIESFELAYRMQQVAPDILDLNSESQSTKQLYGIGQRATDEYGQQCLLARRLCESGVRFVQVNYSDNLATPKWDQHSRIRDHEKHALATDKPVAGLLADLKARGLLEDTLVWWGGEFGRTPFAQGSDGRDHNPKGFTIWLAGGGIKPGLTYGATDEFGYEAVENRVHMHDLHATLLHQLGLNHEKLTYRFAGRDFRLTDVHGQVVRDILA